MQIHADKRAAILKFYTRKTADRKRAIFRRIPARRDYTDNFLHLETHESQTCLTLAKNSFNGGTQPDSCTKI